MNRRIFLGFISIVATLGLVSGATYAFFSDVSSSTGNVLAAGTLDLQLDDDNEGVGQTVTQSLSFNALVPGGSTTKSISLHNGGSVPVAEVELAADKTADDGDGFNIEDVIELQIMTGSDATCTGGTNHTAAVAAGIADGLMPVTLAELIATSGYDALPGLAPSGTYWMCVTSTMQSTAGNNYQGDSVTFDVLFTANQDASQ